MQKLEQIGVVKRAVEKIIKVSPEGDADSEHEITLLFRELTRREFLALARAQKLSHQLEVEIRLQQPGIPEQGGASLLDHSVNGGATVD